MHDNSLVAENHATRVDNKMANKNLVLVAVSLLALFAIAAVPAEAVWNLNFTVALPNGTAVQYANVTVYLESPPNADNLNGSVSAWSSSTGLANLTIITDSATALYNLFIVYNRTDAYGGYYTHVNPALPAMTKAGWLATLEGQTIRLVPALNLYMIAFNDTIVNETYYVWPNGTIGGYNGSVPKVGGGNQIAGRTAGNGSASIWDIFSTNNGTGFTNNIRFNFTSTNFSSGGSMLSNNTQGTSFAYVIIDKVKGLPIRYLKVSNNVTNVTHTVNSPFSSYNRTTSTIVGTNKPGMAPGQIAAEILPLDRNYTVIFYSVTGESPPRSVDIINPATNSSINLTARSNDIATYVVGVTMNFTTTLVNVSGYIFTPTANTGEGGPMINVTNLTAVPFISNEFAPLAARLRFPLTTIAYSPSINKTIGAMNYTSYNYTISLAMRTSWILVASGQNKTGAGLVPWQGNYIGMTNVTVGTAAVAGINFTMRQGYAPTQLSTNFTGNYSSVLHGDNSLPTNTSQTWLQVVGADTNATVAGVSFVVVELKFNNTQGPGLVVNTTEGAQMVTAKFIMETDATGLAAFTFPVNNSARVKVFNPRYAPREFLLTPANLAANASINLTLAPFRPSVPTGGEFNGMVGGAYQESARISVVGFNSTCDQITTLIPDGCTLLSGNDPSQINPFRTMLFGNKVSVRVRMSDGFNIHFRGVDVWSSALPEPQTDTAALSYSSTARTNKLWRIGSLAPDVYDEVYVGIPYTENTDVDEREAVNVSIPTLYDENWNVVWNVSTNGTPISNSAAFNSTRFTDWNLSIISNDTLGGVICSADSGAANHACYVNATENMVWIRLPHFSGGAANLLSARVAGTTGATTSGGSGGSGGGGGGATGGTSQSFVSTTVTAQAPVTNDVTKSEIGVTQVEYTLSENANNVKLEVNKLADKPADIAAAPAGTAYRYIELKLTNAPTSAISSAKVKFVVDKSWVTENNADAATVALQRWDGSSWQVLSTSYTGETDTTYTYEATTPGFSTFAITAQTKAGSAATIPATETSTTPAAGNKPARTVTSPATGGSNTAMWVIVAIIVIAVVVGLAMKGRNKKKWY